MRERKFRGRAAVSLLVTAVLAASCSSAKHKGPVDAGLDAGAVDAGIDAGPAPTGPGSTTSNNTGTVASTPLQALKCSDHVCPDPGLDLFNTLSGFAAGIGIPIPAAAGGLLQQACCTTDKACGIQVQGQGCVGVPKSDPRCPDVVQAGATQPSCCIEATGVCGINGAQSGQGCISANSGFAALFGPPAPVVMCGTAPVDAGTDAGTKDAGHPVDDAGQEGADAGR